MLPTTAAVPQSTAASLSATTRSIASRSIIPAPITTADAAAIQFVLMRGPALPPVRALAGMSRQRATARTACHQMCAQPTTAGAGVTRFARLPTTLGSARARLVRLAQTEPTAQVRQMIAPVRGFADSHSQHGARVEQAPTRPRRLRARLIGNA